MRHQARSYALQALYQAELLQSKAMKNADRFLEQLDTTPEIKTFARELVEGTLLHRKHIDRYLRRNLEHWKLNRLSTIVRNILRLASYELYHHPELSHSVVINEAVELCKDFVDDTSHALTNSVLQRVYDQIQEERKTKASEKLAETSKKEESVKAEESVKTIETAIIEETAITEESVKAEETAKPNPYRKKQKTESKYKS